MPNAIETIILKSFKGVISKIRILKMSKNPLMRFSLASHILTFRQVGRNLAAVFIVRDNQYLLDHSRTQTEVLRKYDPDWEYLPDGQI